MNTSIVKALKSVVKTSKAALAIIAILVISFISAFAYILIVGHPSLETANTTSIAIGKGILIVSFVAMVGYEIYIRIANKRQ